MSTARLVLIIGVITTLAYSWAPFDFGFNNPSPERLGPVFQPLRTASQLRDLVPHFLVFACLAVLFVLSRAGRGRLSRVMLSLTALAILIETGQLFVSGRHAQIFDTIAHLSGALTGILVGGLLEKKSAQTVPHQRPVQVAILSVTTIAWLAIAWFPLLVASSLRDWDASFPLMVGDEVGGGRAWRGEIRYLALYDRALGPAKVALCFKTVGDPSRSRYREEMGLLGGYDFRLTRRPDSVPGAQSHSVLRVTDLEDTTVPPGPGFVVAEPRVICADGAARDLTRHLQWSGAFSVEVWLRPASLSQSGPARIVTLSSGPWVRNFTLGQEQDALVFRVRNAVSGPNGTNHQLEARGLVRERLQHIVASYDHGVSALFVDGRQAGPARDVRSPALPLGLGDRPIAEAIIVLLCALPLIVSARTVLSVRNAAFFFTVVALLGLIPLWLSDPVNAEASRPVRLACFVMAAAVASLLSALPRPLKNEVQ